MIGIEEFVGAVTVAVIAVLLLTSPNEVDQPIKLPDAVEIHQSPTEPIDPPIHYVPPQLRMAVDVPRALRQANWGRGGSCTYAAAAQVLKQHSRLEAAEWIQRNFSGGAYVEDIARIFRRLGIKYRMSGTGTGDASVLEFADKGRHTAVVYYFGGHCVTFLGFETRRGREYAVLIDNNTPYKYDWIKKSTFLRRWRGAHGGGAIVPLLDPNPARPYSLLNHKVKR